MGVLWSVQTNELKSLRTSNGITSGYRGKKMSKELEELKEIKKLLIASLIVSGVESSTIAKILGYKSKSSITNDFPITELKKTK